ncbi:MAG: KH domain-containing protein [Nanoarchaeota archaeon]|nr:KH domain-containing protein [Nanoarchaeota archaeon]
MEQLKIPKERIACLIGSKGKDKREIEQKTNTLLKINSEEGDVIIEGESLNCFNCKKIVKAIGRGFNPKVALMLLDENYHFELVNIEDYTKSKNDLIRIKARLIGAQGKAWKSIERLTNTYLSVYGKTVGIIGLYKEVSLAKQAIINLLQGSKHGNVYTYIEKQKARIL